MSTNNERYELNKNLAQMLKGGVIMDVTTPEQAKIAEAAGACAVMALERIPADIRAAGAPFVESVHADASGNTPEILSIVENRIVGVKYKNQMAFAFHPELDQDTRIHEAFLGMIR